MYVKLNLFVICVVLFNFGECDKCEDVYKCVSDWIATALRMPPSTNFTVDTIEEVTKTQASEDSLLKDLTLFLTDKFSNLFEKESLLEVIENRTNISVQTFKINESIIDTSPSTKVTTVKPDLIDNDHSYINNHNPNNVFEYLNFDKIHSDIVIGKKTTSAYGISENSSESNRKHSDITGNESLVVSTTHASNTIEKTTSASTYKESYETKSQYSSHATIDILNDTTTTPTYLSSEGVLEIKSKNNATIQNATNVNVTTMTPEINKENLDRTSTHKEVNNKNFKNITYIVEISQTMKLPYLNSSDNSPTTPKIYDKYTLSNKEHKKLEKVSYVADNIDATFKTTTLTNLNSNDNPPTTSKTFVKNTTEDTQKNEIPFDDSDENSFHHSDNEIDIGQLEPDNLTDYLDIDYVDIYRDTTNEDVEFTPVIYTTTTTKTPKFLVIEKPEDGIESVYPWIAALFIMNANTNQFEYICDGVVVSERVILTAARCVIKSDATVDVSSILVILGKRSLQAMGLNEIVLRVKSIKLHENFIPTAGKVDNDLAVIILAERVSFNVYIQPAPLGVNTSEPLAIATTGWHVTGSLQPLYLGLQTTKRCKRESDSNNIVCFTLGDNETTCPSYGGVLVDRQDDNNWQLRGIASGNPMNGGVCFNKDLAFTRIGNYFEWIKKNIMEASK